MINLIVDIMQTLEIREDIYDRFLKFKLKYKPLLSNEDFIQFLMTQFENYSCENFVCNGHINGVTENSNVDSKDFENKTKFKEGDINLNNISQIEKIISLKNSQIKSSINYQLYTCPECKYVSGNQMEIEHHFNECHYMSGAFPCTCGQCFNNMAQFLAHYIICPIAATDLQHNNFTEVLFEDIEIDEEEKVINNQINENQSPINQSRELTPCLSEDSNDQPLDFHMHSPTNSNPLNLVKNENINKDSPPLTDYSINAMNFDNNNSSSNDKNRLPENVTNNTSSLSASPPANTDKPKKAGKIYQCEHCEKNFKSKGLLDQHKHLHFPPRHECEFCGRRFRWPPQFYTHKQQCSKRKNVINDVSQEGNNVKKHNYNFSPVTSTYNHMDSNRNQQQSENVYAHHQTVEQCLCGYQSNRLTDMYEHQHSCITSARAMILQKIIDYKSIQTSSLLPNIPTVNGIPLSAPSVHSVMQNFMPNSTHTYSTLPLSDNVGPSPNLPPATTIITPTSKQSDEKPFECDFCESKFMTKISLKQHLDGKHSDQAKYCCEKCGKGYFWNASYNYHKKKCMIKPLCIATGQGLNL